jgi:hypothetical protein
MRKILNINIEMVVIFQGNTGDANAVNHINTPVTMKPVVTENSPSSPGIPPLGIRRIRWGGGEREIDGGGGFLKLRSDFLILG